MSQLAFHDAVVRGCQRWAERRASFRPAGEIIDTSQYDVAPLDEAHAKAFVLEHHYSGSYPAARFRFGLFRHGSLAGVAVYSQPVNNRTLAVLPVAENAVELGRFVLLDEVPGNGETWFLGRCFAALRKLAVPGVVSFSDPIPRETADGARVFPGHFGTIYQAHNAAFLGRGTADTLRLLPDGRAFSKRAMQKVRARERGWRYSAALLERFGAATLREDEDSRAWLTRWVQALTRPLKHPGNFKYAWTLQGRRLASIAAYPKKEVANAAR